MFIRTLGRIFFEALLLLGGDGGLGRSFAGQRIAANIAKLPELLGRKDLDRLRLPPPALAQQS